MTKSIRNNTNTILNTGTVKDPAYLIATAHVTKGADKISFAYLVEGVIKARLIPVNSKRILGTTEKKVSQKVTPRDVRILANADAPKVRTPRTPKDEVKEERAPKGNKSEKFTSKKALIEALHEKYEDVKRGKRVTKGDVVQIQYKTEEGKLVGIWKPTTKTGLMK